MRRTGLAALACALLACVAAGCGAGHAAVGGRESAGIFITRILREELSGQWGKQWSELHPGHQKLITRAQYVACSRALATNVGTGKETYRVLRVKRVAIHVRGVPQTTAALVTISVRAPGNTTTPTYQLHAVEVKGRWKWILGGRFLSAVEHGRCLDGEPLLSTSA